MRLCPITPPSQEPVTLDEVKTYLRLATDEEDDFLKIIISSSRASVENITGRALLKQQWHLRLIPPYPPSCPLVKSAKETLLVTLPLPPLLKIDSVKTRDKEVSYRRIEANKLALSSLLWGQEIFIDFWAGYGETTTDLPPDLKMAVLMATRFLYEGQPISLPLLAPYKVLRLT